MFFKAGVVFASFHSLVATAFHQVQKVAGMNLHDCLPRKDQHWLEAETSCLSQLTFASSSSLGYGESSDYLFNPYMGVCHYTRQKLYL